MTRSTQRVNCIEHTCVVEYLMCNIHRALNPKQRLTSLSSLNQLRITFLIKHPGTRRWTTELLGELESNNVLQTPPTHFHEMVFKAYNKGMCSNYEPGVEIHLGALFPPA
jgi:hypothetical protein